MPKIRNTQSSLLFVVEGPTLNHEHFTTRNSPMAASCIMLSCHNIFFYRLWQAGIQQEHISIFTTKLFWYVRTYFLSNNDKKKQCICNGIGHKDSSHSICWQQIYHLHVSLWQSCFRLKNVVHKTMAMPSARSVTIDGKSSFWCISRPSSPTLWQPVTQGIYNARLDMDATSKYNCHFIQ